MSTAAEVQAIINSATAKADDTLAQGKAFLDNLAELADVDLDPGTPQFETLFILLLFMEEIAALLKNKPAAPDLDEIEATFDNVPDVKVDSIEIPFIPPWDKAPPEISTEGKPDPSVSATKPVYQGMEESSIPQKPAITIPKPPTLTPLGALPVCDQIEYPDWIAVRPTDTIGTPPDVMTYDETAFSSSSGLQGIIAQMLADDLTNGGLGISPMDEQDLRERAHDAELVQAQAAQSLITDKFAALGYTTPPGPMASQLIKAIQDATLAIVTHGREIEINRAELKRKTREVSLATGVNLLQIEMNYHNVLWQRTLEAAKAIQDAGISVFKAKIDRYNAAVELYKTDASVFAQRVQAEIAKVEVFKAQVEAYLAKVQVQKGQIEIYVAQVNACNTLVELYNAELKGAEIFYSVQKTKLEAFKIQMDAYLMEYQIKELEYKIWAMGIEGDATKLKAYQLELESYKEMLGGVKTKAEISMMNVNAQIATGELDLKAYSEKLAQFSEVIKLTSLNNGMKLDKWKGNIDMWKASLDARLKQEVANVQKGEANSRTVQIEVAHRIEKVKVSLERLKAQADLKLKAAVSGSEIYSRIASGALSMVTTMAAISHTTTATG